MKIAIITSNHLRHKFFAKKIAKIVDVDVCIFESKPLNTQSLKDSELKYFGDLKNYKFDSNQILIQKGEINSDKIHNDLIKYHIDYIFTFGCSLLFYQEYLKFHQKSVLIFILGLSNITEVLIAVCGQRGIIDSI